jgi:hypothetical protein
MEDEKLSRRYFRVFVRTGQARGPYSFESNVAQIFQSDRIAIGGGTTSSPREISKPWAISEK